MSKQRLLFITTGGTIACVRSQQGLKPVLSSEELLAHLPELKELCCPETLALCNIDSTDLGPEHWLMMAKASISRCGIPPTPKLSTMIQS